MPVAIGIAAALVSIGAGIYTAVDSADTRAKSIDLQKKALEQQGVVDLAQKRKLDAEANAIDAHLFETPAQMANNTISASDGSGIDAGVIVELAAVGLLAFVGYKAIK